MKKVFLKILILLILFSIIIFNISFAIIGKVNDSNIRVRSGPSTEDTETLTNLYLNDPVEVIEKVGDWYKVTTEGDITGYISAEFLNVDDDDIPTSDAEIIESDEIKTEDTEKTEKIEDTDTKKTDDKKVEEDTKDNKNEEKEIVLTKKITKNIKGKYMPLIYSTDKITFKKNETLNIHDERGLWTKVSNKTNEAWVLTSSLE